MSRRLSTHVEVAGILRRFTAAGEFATILRKGDEEGGDVLLIVSNRGRHVACLERALGSSGDYRWQAVGPAESASFADVREFLARRTRFDSDLWIVELDIAEAERFIAETIGSA